ncbi:hypothetical protein KsCSTR_45030 [Candidatus Kuenenia stuttgartiensis]|uniref:Uncharacterized protein n=1 Tax=Kuenenia stuttgartiensis TaxID=174633 RepID=A0A2C9CGI0_KUEST|nr:MULTISPECIES: hypothetical protein [Kuenenia]MBE7545849.1 hypothetical protein [Planctomycetia bacterium]MBZ0191393.1 hypothetical protein [Candidatus Kuenenia stuttgartiensis]MCF6152638.1 hypothetical protein [Candidatus Kuenenia stuttgartiensis]MCL4727622.1 hypothetical protein [Candidatus Kuenenia stuttgartiensis]MCZ7622871.1 hypothetical protein [Candidatus Kuenenia sp.]
MPLKILADEDVDFRLIKNLRTTGNAHPKLLFGNVTAPETTSAGSGYKPGPAWNLLNDKSVSILSIISESFLSLIHFTSI